MCACPLMGLLWPVSRFDLLVDWTVIGLKSHSQARKTEGGMQTARGASGVRLASWNDAAAGRDASHGRHVRWRLAVAGYHHARASGYGRWIMAYRPQKVVRCNLGDV